MITYSWIWDTDVFTAAGPINGPQLKLAVNTGKDLEAIVSPVTVIVIDTDTNCRSEMQCYYTPDGMICDEDFVPCVNPEDLVVTLEEIFTCAKPLTLTVNTF